ncbi:MAG: hypothetical protein Q8Q49_03810 [bacterium]|nr:hypothetical protein [bacterium]
MENVLCLYKPVGLSPLGCIRLFQETNPSYQELTLSYAGRLDPMAEGLLLVLVGNENKQRAKYLSLKKTYQFRVVFGIRTDSYDKMGMPKLRYGKTLDKERKDMLKKYIPTLLGESIQEYPPYSSKTVNGKPLFYWAREGKISSIVRPSKKVTISSLTGHGLGTIPSQKLLSQVVSSVQSVDGLFRQQEIIGAWNRLLQNSKATFSVYTFTLTCSSGTYVRSLVNQFGEYLKTGAFALSIKRTRIGDFTLVNATHVG